MRESLSGRSIEDGCQWPTMWAVEEIFFDGFSIPETLELENETNTVEPRGVAFLSSYIKHGSTYKKDDTCFCIFYSKARLRKGVDETVDVNIFAKIGKRIRWEERKKTFNQIGIFCGIIPEA